MPTYRLVNDRSVPLETFTAAADVAARVRGRQLADLFIHAGQLESGRRMDFTVQRQHDGGWAFISAWVPRPRSEPA